MEGTPIVGQNSSDSGCISGTFESSHSFYESTPKEDQNADNNTPNAFGFTRKRKARDIQVRKLADVIESCPSTPQFSSTLNEPHNFKDLSSLANGLEDFHIYNSSKYFKDLNGRPKIPSEPCTPEKKTPSGFSKYIESPRLEAQQLLYPNLKEVKSSPSLKLGRDVLLSSSTAKKALFLTNTFYNIVRTPVIMANIFQYLSNGDLYRFGMVAKCCLKAIESNKLANERYLAYKEVYRVNKENYRITPPNSPEKDDTLSTTEASNANFLYFFNMGQSLNEQQQLQKCRKCAKACIVEHNIGQCEKCGFTYCLLCDSVANSPENFHDRCQQSKLLIKPRNQLCDLSNSNLNDVIENSSFSLLNSSSSGFYSDCDLTPKTGKSVKRNLSNSLTGCCVGGKPKVLSNNNRIVSKKTVIQRRSSIVPVVVAENQPKNEIIEPSSPPKVKNYAICSKQSKRNLKRLTR